MKKKVLTAAVFLALALLVGLIGINWVVQKYLLTRNERGLIETALRNNEYLSKKFGKDYVIEAIDAGSEAFFNFDGSKYGTYPFLITNEKGISNLKVKWRRQSVSDDVLIEVYETTKERSPDLIFSEVINIVKE